MVEGAPFRDSGAGAREGEHRTSSLCPASWGFWLLFLSVHLLLRAPSAASPADARL